MTTAQLFTTILVVVFFAVMLAVGFICKKKASDVDGFVLGGRSVGPWLTAFAYGTSYFSAVIFVGYAGQFGWNFGVASTWIGLGNAFIGSLLAWNILGRRTRVMTQHLNSKTMPDFFQKRYNSNALKIAASIIVFIFLIPYTASLYNGLSSLFAIAFNVPYWVCILLMAVLTGIYVIFGGYMATAINDFIQGVIMLVGIIAVVLAVLNTNGGLMGSMQALSETGGWEYTSFFGPNPVFLIVVVLLTSLGTWGLPQMVGKFYAISNEAAIKKGTLISTIFAIIVAGGCYFLGGFGRLFVTPETVAEKGYDVIVPTMLENLSPYVIGIVIVLVLSASMSTLSSLVLTSASTLTLDVIVPASKKEKSEKNKLTIMRAFIVFFILLSAAIAILKDTIWSDFVFIAQMMGVSWGALAGAFLAPFLCGLYFKKTTRPAVWTSFILGVGIMVIQLLISLKVFSVAEIPVLNVIFSNSLYSGVFAMLLGLIVVPIVSLATQNGKPENVEEMFECYNTEITVPVKTSLNDK